MGEAERREAKLLRSSELGGNRSPRPHANGPSCARVGRAKAPVPTRAGASQRVQEAKQVFLLGWSQPMELLCYFPRFAFVASNRIP